MYYRKMWAVLQDQIYAFRGYHVDNRDIKELVRVWAENKWATFSAYMPKPTLVVPVNWTLNEEEIFQYAREMERDFGIPISTFPIASLVENRHPETGERLGRFLRKLVPEHARPKFDRAWNEFMSKIRVRGGLVITVSPVELLSISEFTTGWTSCHSVSARVACHFESNLLYATDKHAVLAYFYSSTDPLGIPIKRWRQLFYAFPEQNAIVASRQYPQENEYLAEVALQTLFELFRIEPRYCWRPYVEVIEPDLYLPSNCLPYLDTGYWVAYARERIYLTMDMRTPILHTALFQKILEAFAVYCSICNMPVRETELVFDSDGHPLCPACCEQYYTYCTVCGRLVHRDDAAWDDDDRPYCRNCAIEREACLMCGRISYWRNLVRVYSPSRNAVVYLCAPCASGLRIARCACGQYVMQEDGSCSCGQEVACEPRS